ncbi:hypothetical protein GH733_019239 [Mirounga leonina]|nr:hypothetical protein GH733_019239 [Mirounga leonina]
MFLTALTIPLDRTVPAGDVQPRASLATGSLGGGSRPFVLNPPAMAREAQPCPRGKPAAPVLSVNSDCLKPSFLEKHIQFCTLERPFPCVPFGVAFMTPSSLDKHWHIQTRLRSSPLSCEAGGGGAAS